MGTHKTGTTAIQAFSVANREALLRQGIHYPDFSPMANGPNTGHHAWAHAFSSKPQGLSRDQAQALTRHWHDRALEQQHAVVVSAEAMYRHVLGQGDFAAQRTAYLEVLREVLAGFEVVPVLVFRRPDDYIRSMYQEAVAYRSVPRVLPAFADYVSKPPPGIDYADNAAFVEAVFGKLKVLLYEDLAASSASLGEAFYEALGVPLDGCSPAARVRASLSAEETVLKNQANQHLASRQESQAFIESLRTPGMQDRIRQAYPAPPYDLWPDAASRQAFLDSRSDDIARLRERYFPARDRLFPPLDEARQAIPVPPPPAELMEQALARLPG